MLILAPLALLLPAALPVERDEAPLPFQGEAAQQVRIEQRVTIVVSPRPASALPFQQTAMGDAAPLSKPIKFNEKKIGKCLPVTGIAGVRPGEKNKLILFMRDHRLVSATLDKACQGRDYYSGFRVAKNGDGMICTGRDELQARSGANCKVSGFRQLVVDDD